MATMTEAGPAVRQSPNDARLYRSLHLPNGLNVLLIHDPEAAGQAQAAPAAAGGGGTRQEGDREEDLDSLASGSGSSEGEEEEDGSGSEEEDGETGGDSEEEHEHVHHHDPRRAPHHAGPVKKAAAALSVGVGSLSDPWELQGLSHYLEHMLFMGSERYPDENDYDAFLSAHGGSSNAMTEAEATTYYFDVSPDCLRGALDRFAQFFTCPLVKQDAMEREVEAVNNEFTGVLQSDGCRLQQLKYHTSRPGHPFCKFGWGNRKSLVEDPQQAGVDVRSHLLRYYREQYSAERMNLVVLGGEPLNTLQQWAAELFSGVPGGRGPAPEFGSVGLPFQGGKLYVMPAVRDEHKLQATFQLPCLNKLYGKKAEEYLSHLVGHEGKGSLLSALKARGWATELCAGVSDQSTATWLFDVTITLTEAGLAEGMGCGLGCVRLLFEYLNMLRQAGPQQWAYEEMAAIAGMKFRFQEEEDAADYVTQLATDLHVYPPHMVLEGPFYYEGFDPQLISELLGGMTPAAVRLDLQSHAYDQCRAVLEAAVPGASISCEPWFGIPFAEAALPADLLQTWEAAAPSPDLSLPPRNTYLPSDFTLVAPAPAAEQPAAEREAAAANGHTAAVEDSPSRAVEALLEGGDAAAFPSPPDLLLDEPGLRLWHKVDVAFRLPRVNAYFKLVSPLTYDTVRNAALAHLLLKLLEDALCETAYLAEVAGLQYSTWFEGRQGLDLRVDGFSHKLPLLCRFIFTTLAGLQPDADAFQRVKEALVRQYRNVNVKVLKHATYLRLMALKDLMWPAPAVLEELEGLCCEDVQRYLPAFLSSLHIEALVHGNVLAQGALELGLGVRGALLGAAGAQPLAADARPVDRCLQLPRPCSLLHRAPAKNGEEENSVVEAYYQCCPDTDADRALVDLMDQILYEPVYNVLRTQEQLGYTVHSGMRLTHGVLGFCILVVSGVHGPAHLDARIETFLESFGDRLSGMSEEEFEKHRAALLSTKLMKDRNMVEESDRHWACIAARRYNFGARRDEVAHLRLVTLQQVQAFYTKYLQPGSPSRRKLGVHILGRGHQQELGAAPPAGVELCEEPAALKQGLPFYHAIVGTPASGKQPAS